MKERSSHRKNIFFSTKIYLRLQCLMPCSTKTIWKTSNEIPVVESLYYEIVALKSQHTNFTKRRILHRILSLKVSKTFQNSFSIEQRLTVASEQFRRTAFNHGTILRTGITCKKIPCYMRDSTCRSFIVKEAKIFC